MTHCLSFQVILAPLDNEKTCLASRFFEYGLYRTIELVLRVFKIAWHELSKNDNVVVTFAGCYKCSNSCCWCIWYWSFSIANFSVLVSRVWNSIILFLSLELSQKFKQFLVKRILMGIIMICLGLMCRYFQS